MKINIRPNKSHRTEVLLDNNYIYQTGDDLFITAHNISKLLRAMNIQCEILVHGVNYNEFITSQEVLSKS